MPGYHLTRRRKQAQSSAQGTRTRQQFHAAQNNRQSRIKVYSSGNLTVGTAAVMPDSNDYNFSESQNVVRNR